MEAEAQANEKTHEEEVQLRMKFEQKLNSMHSAHRDLESKYQRILKDFGNSQKHTNTLTAKINTQISELTELKALKVENEQRITQCKQEMMSTQLQLRTTKDLM